MWGAKGPSREEGPLESRKGIGVEVGGWWEERMAVSGGAIWKAFQALCLVDVILGSSGRGVLLH